MAFVSQSNPQDRKKLGKLRQKICLGWETISFCWENNNVLVIITKYLVRSAGCSVCLKLGGASYRCPHHPPKMKKVRWCPQALARLVNIIRLTMINCWICGRWL
jgi:hypothetical protein